ncbi:MAG: hypothetical protein ACPGLV_19120, partial [Bacteroidia bacterium]
LFSSKMYYNHQLNITSLVLLHFVFDNGSYFLFFGDKGYKNEFKFSFQFNKGEAFVDFLIKNQVKYYEYSVLEVLSTGYINKFKLKNNKVIQLETYANGTTSGLMIYDLSTSNTNEKVLHHLPIAKINLGSKLREIKLVSHKKSTSGRLPAEFKKQLKKDELIGEKMPYYILVFIIVGLVMLYFVIFQ